MTMKCSYKKICALILTLVMALSVTGCTDDSSSSLPEEKPSVYPFVNTLKRTGRQYHADSGGTGSGRTGEAEGG